MSKIEGLQIFVFCPNQQKSDQKNGQTASLVDILWSHLIKKSSLWRIAEPGTKRKQFRFLPLWGFFLGWFFFLKEKKRKMEEIWWWCCFFLNAFDSSHGFWSLRSSLKCNLLQETRTKKGNQGQIQLNFQAFHVDFYFTMIKSMNSQSMCETPGVQIFLHRLASWDIWNPPDLWSPPRKTCVLPTQRITLFFHEILKSLQSYHKI